MDPDQARHFVGPDLDPNCLQRLSADYTICKQFDLLRFQDRVGSERFTKISSYCCHDGRFNAHLWRQHPQ